MSHVVESRNQENFIQKKSLFGWHRLVWQCGFVCRSLAVFTSLLLLSESVTATPGRMGASIAQQPATTSPDATRAAAKRAYQEADRLHKQGTAESIRQAIAKFEEALPLYRAVGDKAMEAVTLLVIGKIYDDLGEKQKALSYYSQALPLSHAVGDRAGEATTLNNIGSVYDDLGEKQKALSFYSQALPLEQAVGDHAREAGTLNNIGIVYSDLGEKQQALSYYSQSLPLLRAVGDRAGEAGTLSNIGSVYNSLGEKQQALSYYSQALPIRRAVGDRAGEATTLNNIGGVYISLGEKQKALSYYSQALPLRRVVGNRAGEATTLNNIGGVYYRLGEKQKALSYYSQSLPLSRAVGDRSGEAKTLNNIGSVYNSLGEKQQALSYYSQALPLWRTVGDKDGEATTLSNIAYLERSRGNLNAALTQMEAAIKIIDSLRTKIVNQQLRASYFASVQDYYKFYIDLLMQLHKTNPSQRYDALALHASERARARNLLELLKEARADIRSGIDSQLVVKERNLQQQLDALEHQKYQLFNGQYQQPQLDTLNNEIESHISELDDVQAQIRVTSPRYAALTQPQPLNLQQIQQQVLDDNTLLLEYSLGKDRSYLWVVSKTGIASYELPKRADIEAAAQDFYKLLNSETYRLGTQREIETKLSQMLLSPVASQLGNKRLLIVGDGILQSLPFAALPIPQNTQASSLLPTFRLEMNFQAHSLSPLKRTESKSPVGFNRLELLARELIPWQVTPLLVEHEIVSLPSASTIAVLRDDVKGRQPAAKTVAVLADPVFTHDDERFKNTVDPGSACTPIAKTGSSSAVVANIPEDLKRSALQVGATLSRLPYTRCEAEGILNLVPATERQQAFDFAASRNAVTSPNLSQYRIIHLATHGLFNEQHPELSGVVMSLVDEKGAPQDGFLRLHDIYNLNLPAELVVLSACQTGLGKEIEGEGIVGLTRGFMYAGAERVVVSLWRVSDRATPELMSKFYQQMLQKGIKPTAALRAAQLEMWRSQQWQSPYYWAAFTIQGEWR